MAGTRDPLEQLWQAVSRLSLLVVADETPETTLVRIVAVLLQTIDHADGAGVSLVKGRVIETAAGTSDLQRRVDELQTETGQGPCFEAIREPEARVYRIDDMSTEERWPLFCQRVSALGVQSKIAFVLDVDGKVLGALNLYASRPGAFDSADETIGCVFADHAAVALANAQTHAANRLEVEQLEEALRARDVIGRAKGILMAREGLTEDQAFARLRDISQHLNMKLRDVATDMAVAFPVVEGEAR